MEGPPVETLESLVLNDHDGPLSTNASTRQISDFGVAAQHQNQERSAPTHLSSLSALALNSSSSLVSSALPSAVYLVLTREYSKSDNEIKKAFNKAPPSEKVGKNQANFDKIGMLCI
jgi:hypothetical protein